LNFAYHLLVPLVEIVISHGINAAATMNPKVYQTALGYKMMC